MKTQESIGKFISCIHRYAQMYLDRKLKTYNIGSGQFSFLIRLFTDDGINQENLAESLKVDKATSAGAIRKLIEAGYVTKQRDTVDRRAFRIFLTSKGKEIEPSIKKISTELTEVILSTFTDEEKAFILKFLKEMVQNASSIKH